VCWFAFGLGVGCEVRWWEWCFVVLGLEFGVEGGKVEVEADGVAVQVNGDAGEQEREMEEEMDVPLLSWLLWVLWWY
jgi:hypothetical protein